VSRLPPPTPLTIPATRAAVATTARGMELRIDARAAEVVAMLGYIPMELLGRFHERTFDLMNHHRRSVLKHHRFPAGRRAQKMLGARLYRYGARTRDPVKIEQLVGESFAVEPSGAFGDAMRVWERGGTVRTSEAMAIPFFAGLSGKGGRGARVSAKFRKLLEAGLFDVAKGRGILFEPTVSRRRLKGVEGQTGYRSVIYGAARRRRVQPPVLGFYERFQSILPVHMAKFDRDLSLALTSAGREAIRARYADDRIFRGSFEQQYKQELRKYLEMNKVVGSEARAVIARARADARTRSEKGVA
jgi:hypothetical protein